MIGRGLNSRIAPRVCRINIASWCIINAPRIASVYGCFADNLLTIIVETTYFLPKTCLSTIRVIKTNKIALANALQAPTTRTERRKNQKTRNGWSFLLFKVQGRDSSMTKSCYLNVWQVKSDMEIERDKLKVRTKGRGRRRISDDERDFWRHYDLYEALSSCSNRRYRLRRLTIARRFTGHFSDAAFGSHDPFRSQRAWGSACYPLHRHLIAELLVGIYFITSPSVLSIVILFKWLLRILDRESLKNRIHQIDTLLSS